MKFDKYNVLKYELFEQLLPEMFYTMKEEERDLFIEELENTSGNEIYDLFNSLCKEDKVNCPYEEKDFAINRFERGGVRFIEMCVPESSAQINHVLRAYILIAHERKNEEIKHMRYFMVKRFFQNGMVHVMYITPDNEVMLGDELTNHMDDKKYEYRTVARNFIMVLLNELIVGKVEAELNLEDK